MHDENCLVLKRNRHIFLFSFFSSSTKKNLKQKKRKRKAKFKRGRRDDERRVKSCLVRSLIYSSSSYFHLQFSFRFLTVVCETSKTIKLNNLSMAYGIVRLKYRRILNYRGWFSSSVQHSLSNECTMRSRHRPFCSFLLTNICRRRRRR